MLLFTALIMAAPVAVQPARAMPVVIPGGEGKRCPETPMSLARKMGKGSPRATPLSQLPAGQMFMAVDRRVDGCPVPLTATEYRGSGRR